jgi:hypothetical protein
VTRPSDAEVDEALLLIADLATLAWSAGYDQASKAGLRARDVLYRATRPRVLWPQLEVAKALGVDPGNVRRQRGLPAPAQVLPRPTPTDPDRTFEQWDADEILEYKAGKDGL